MKLQWKDCFVTMKTKCCIWLLTGMTICWWPHLDCSRSWAAWQVHRPSDRCATARFAPRIPRQQGFVVHSHPHPSSRWSLAGGNKHYRFPPARLKPIIKCSSFQTALHATSSHRRLYLLKTHILTTDLSFYCSREDCQLYQEERVKLTRVQCLWLHCILLRQDSFLPCRQYCIRFRVDLPPTANLLSLQASKAEF